MRVLLISLGDLEHCPRARRLFAHLDGYDVTVINERSLESYVRVAESSFRAKCANALAILFGRGEAYLRRKYVLEGSGSRAFDVIICHDLLLLPLVYAQFTFRRLVFDAREFYPAQFEHSAVWRCTAGRLSHQLCQEYLPRIESLMTVSGGVARAYREAFGVEMELAPSFPCYCELPVRAPGSPIKLVHHGNATPNRHLENMVEMMGFVSDDYSLDIYLVPQNQAYYRRLEEMCRTRTNVTLHQPVPSDSLPTVLNDYDIGLFVPPASTRNLGLALPNKLFEYIQARLMLMVSPLEEAAEFVNHHSLGVVADSARPVDLARAVESVGRDQVLEYKRRSDKLASEMSSAAFAAPFLRAVESAALHPFPSR